jgi:hypothetical protein
MPFDEGVLHRYSLAKYAVDFPKRRFPLIPRVVGSLADGFEGMAVMQP